MLKFVDSSTLSALQQFYTFIIIIIIIMEFVDSSTLSVLHTEPKLAKKWVIIILSHLWIRGLCYTFSTLSSSSSSSSWIRRQFYTFSTSY